MPTENWYIASLDFYWNLEKGERWDKLGAKISFYIQSVTNYFAKSKKIKQNWTRPEIFDICLSVGEAGN